LVLVSEVMLQQTQVSRVLPKWLAFVERFPTAGECAGAGLDDVLRLWQGLGYPRRARNLQLAAAAVARLGAMPSNLQGLRALPGVGEYTARAVLAFSFEQDVGVVDTNVARVFARVEGRRLTRREVQQLADAAVPPGAAWLWNQALMDLGAVVCRPAPHCGECPLRRQCAWRGEGDDPAVGSAGVSRAQGRFEGSDRQARGALIRALAARAVPVADVPSVMHRSAPTADRLVADLVREGLCVVDAGLVRLPTRVASEGLHAPRASEKPKSATKPPVVEG
jgi:A/G-specific adenine glycosylase